jgi:hypothetical protein
MEYGKRADGSEKGAGYFGELQRPGGGISTEMSIGVGINGKETEIPLLVPTLTPAEVSLLLRGDKPTSVIVDKAYNHAMTRIKQNKSPFAGADDKPVEVK